MNLIHLLTQSDISTATVLIVLPNVIAGIVAWAVISKAKTFAHFSKRVLAMIGVFVIVSNVIAVVILSSLNPDHGFYWLDENEGATWTFALLPTSVIFAVLLASIYEWKIER